MEVIVITVVVAVDIDTNQKGSGMKSRKGFTLIELLVIIAITAMLLAMIIPFLQMVFGFGPQPKNIADIKTVEINSDRLYISSGEEVKVALFHDMVTSREINVSVRGAPSGELMVDENDKYWYVMTPPERKTYQAVFKAAAGSLVEVKNVEIEVR